MCCPAPSLASPTAGRYITVVAASGAQPAPLSLCGVRLLGAAELPLSQRMRQAPAGLATGMAALSVSPAALQPEASLPIGSAAADSCLVAPAAAAANGSTSWELRLDGSYQLLAVRLAATPAAAAAPANNTRLAVSLLDTGGGLVAAWPVPPGSPGGMTLELPAATHAAAMRVQGFASLCQVQLLAASQLPSKSYALAPLPAGGMQGAAGRWQVLDAATGQPPAASSGGGGGDGGAALFDSMAGTCISVRPAWAAAGGSGSALGQLAGLEVQLDRPLR